MSKNIRNLEYSILKVKSSSIEESLTNKMNVESLEKCIYEVYKLKIYNPNAIIVSSKFRNEIYLRVDEKH